MGTQVGDVLGDHQVTGVPRGGMGRSFACTAFSRLGCPLLATMSDLIDGFGLTVQISRFAVSHMRPAAWARYGRDTFLAVVALRIRMRRSAETSQRCRPLARLGRSVCGFRSAGSAGSDGQETRD